MSSRLINFPFLQKCNDQLPQTPRYNGLGGIPIPINILECRQCRHACHSGPNNWSQIERNFIDNYITLSGAETHSYSYFVVPSVHALSAIIYKWILNKYSNTFQTDILFPIIAAEYCVPYS